MQQLDAFYLPTPREYANEFKKQFEARHLARRTDPAVSHQAAVRVHEFAGSHREIILACLKQYGPQTVDEIAKRTCLTGHAIGKRMHELDKTGLARLTGEERLSASGRAERVWAAV